MLVFPSDGGSSTAVGYANVQDIELPRVWRIDIKTMAYVQEE